MQRIISLTHVGHTHNFTLKFLAQINDKWVPVEQIGDAPHNLRIVQIAHSDKAGWVALVEAIKQ